MKYLETLKTALASLLRNKLRTFLTMLGVIIGVFAVVALVSLVGGVENFIVDRFNAIGSNLIFISPGNVGFGQDPAISFTKKTLEEKHVTLIAEALGERIAGVTPSIRVIKKTHYKDKDFLAIITAANADIVNLFGTETIEGRFFNKEEVKNKEKVVILAPNVKKELFGEGVAVGREIKIQGTHFKVIGMSEDEGGPSNDRIFMPYTTAQDVFDIDSITNIVTKARNPSEVESVAAEIEHTLIQELDKNDFTVIMQKDILNSIQDILGVLSIILAAIAGISLVVGGIGIMNIMLVTVNERIKEIGLRKALGATNFDIGSQFFIESIIISVLGGILGLCISWSLTIAIRSIIRAEITVWAILLSLGFSVAIGTIFGTYPAIKASKKDPIEALGHD